MENGKAALEKAGLSLPFPQRDVHIQGGATETGPANVRAA
jgi:hypothetical protein